MSESGQLQVNVTGNASGFQQTMRQVSAHAKKAAGEISSDLGKSWGGLGKGFAGGIAGAFSVEGLARGWDMLRGSFEKFLNTAKGLKDLGEAMQMPVPDVERWRKAATDTGASFNTVQANIASIAQKRQDALTDPKAAEVFNRIGIPRSTVIDTEGVGTSEFARLVQMAGLENDDKKSALVDIIGKRGLKAASTARVVNEQSPDFTDTDIENADRIDKLEQKIDSAKNKAWSNFIGNMLDNPVGTMAKLMNGGAMGVSTIALPSAGTGKEAPEAAAAATAQTDAIKQIAEMAKGGIAEPIILDFIKNQSKPVKASAGDLDFLKSAGVPAGVIASLTKSSKPKDPLDSVLAESKFQRDEREASALDRIEAAKRGNMASLEKRESLQKELDSVRARIAETEGRKAPDNLKGEDLAEWQTKQIEQAAGLKIREQGLLGDMREKPLSLEQNSLGKAGLFTSSSIGGPDSALSYQRETVATLKAIHRELQLDGPLNRL